MKLTRTTASSSVTRAFGALIVALTIALLFSYLLSRPLATAGALTPPSPRPDLLDRPHRPQAATESRPDSN